VSHTELVGPETGVSTEETDGDGDADEKLDVETSGEAVGSAWKPGLDDSEVSANPRPTEIPARIKTMSAVVVTGDESTAPKRTLWRALRTNERSLFGDGTSRSLQVLAQGLEVLPKGSEGWRGRQ